MIYSISRNAITVYLKGFVGLIFVFFTLTSYAESYEDHLGFWIRDNRMELMEVSKEGDTYYFNPEALYKDEKQPLEEHDGRLTFMNGLRFPMVLAVDGQSMGFYRFQFNNITNNQASQLKEGFKYMVLLLAGQLGTNANNARAFILEKIKDAPYQLPNEDKQ